MAGEHVFISYSRADTALMHAVRDVLQAAGLAVWTDENLEPGTSSWKRAIEVALESAHSLVILMSPDAKRSPWVERELTYASTLNIPVFPVLVRGDVASAVPFELIDYQWVEALNSAALDRQIKRLARTIYTSSGVTLPGTLSSADLALAAARPHSARRARRRPNRLALAGLGAGGLLVLVLIIGLSALLVSALRGQGLPATPPADGGGASTPPPAEQDEPTATPTQDSTVEDGCGYSAMWVADLTVPDGTPFDPREHFTKGWLIRNNGCQPWPEGTRFTFIAGDRMRAPAYVELPEVRVAGEYAVEVPMVAPELCGLYSGYWQLRLPEGDFFGKQFYLDIEVPCE